MLDVIGPPPSERRISNDEPIAGDRARLAQTRAMVPALRARVPEGDRPSRLPGQTMDELRGSRLLRLFRPARYGGGEAAAEMGVLFILQTQGPFRLMAYAARGEDALIRERMIMRPQATSVAERCCQIAARLFRASGALTLSRARPFSRIRADIRAGRQHAANQCVGHGRALGAALLGAGVQDMLL